MDWPVSHGDWDPGPLEEGDEGGGWREGGWLGLARTLILRLALI